MARVTPVWVALGAFYAVFDQAIDLRAMRLALETASPWAHARTWTIVLFVSAGIAHVLVRPILMDRRLGWAWRMPWGARMWGALLALPMWVTLLVACLPALLVRDGYAWLEAVALLVWAAPVAVGFATRTWRGALGALAALGVCACVVAAGQYTRWAWWGLAPGSVLAATWAMGAMYARWHGVWGERGLRGRGLRARSPLGAMWWYDARCLWRRARASYVWMCGQLVLCGAFAFAVGRHGGDMAATAFVMAALMSPWSGLVVARLSQTLGAGFFPGRWPMQARTRAWSLVMHAALPPMVMAWACVVVGGGAPWPRLFVVASAPVALATMYVAAHAWVWRRVNAPLYPLFGTLLVLLASFAPPWAAVLMHVAWSAAMFSLAVAGLEAGRRDTPGVRYG